MLQFTFLGLLWLLALLLALTFLAPRIHCRAQPQPQISTPGSIVQPTWELNISTTPANGAGPAPERVVMHSQHVTIGRGAEAGLTIDDEFISTVHAELQQTDGKLIFEDLGSTNGSFVNGLPVQAPTSLQHGDVVRMGKTEIRVL